MHAAGILGILLYAVVLLAASAALGPYLYRALEGQRTWLDPVLGPLDRVLLRAGGIKTDAKDNAVAYFGKFLIASLVLMVITYAVLRLQAVLPLKQTAVTGQSPALAFNTAASFIANCNWQAYAGESLSYLTQMLLMVNQFITPAFGVAVAIAFVRGITQKRNDLGNFWVDLVRILTRLYLPFALLAAILLGLLGLPETFGGPVIAHTLDGIRQTIDRGPLAAFESIKMFGNNGGGFFNANSAHPFESANAVTNIFEIFLMSLVPTTLVFTFGAYAKSRKLAWILATLTVVLLVAGALMVYGLEVQGNPILMHALGLHGANMEGHEVRFGQAGTGLFVSATTAFTTGAVNAMHDSLIPLSGLVPLLFMMLNTVFGAAGAGLLNILMMIIITLFICGLMVGRTPEFLGRKIEGREIGLATVAMLIHPFVILIPTAFALVHSIGTSSILNPGFHGLSEILYAFSSAAANNGSAFAGLNANTPFYNTAIGLVILVGRYLSIAAMLPLAGSMAKKVQVPVSAGTLRTDTWTFGVVYLGVVIIVGALTFFPALSLGPIADQLAMQVGRLF